MKFVHLGSYLKLAAVFLLLGLTSCNSAKKSNVSEKEILGYYHSWQRELEESIVNDFFSPPVASRVYMYANLSVAAVMLDSSDALFTRLKNKNLLTSVPNTQDKPLIALFTFYHTSCFFVFDQTRLNKNYESFKSDLEQNGFTLAQIDTLNEWGKKCANKIISYAKTDGYAQLRSADKYQVKETPGTWKPTPPDYMDGLEPHWGKMRTFLLDSASQFRPLPPLAFSTNKKSAFYAAMQEVYTLSRTDTASERHDIAYYWDCNPLALQHEGHLTYTNKKLTPGGHWLHICLQSARAKKLSFTQTASITALLSVTIYDSFISCWETKYYYNYIRPVTAIQNMLDPSWQPLLITPNFPEYTSGHSVISSAGSAILNRYFGAFTFTDSSELQFGYKARTFHSFLEASDEACISRLYGGIHFREAIEKGKTQGTAIGTFVMNQLNLQSYASPR